MQFEAFYLHGKKSDKFSLNDNMDVEKYHDLNMQPVILEG